jgi:hypothetical protein
MYLELRSTSSRATTTHSDSAFERHELGRQLLIALQHSTVVRRRTDRLNFYSGETIT